MSVKNEPPDSQFAYVVVAARRARQLMNGAPPLVDNPKSRQSTRVAEQELNRGLLQFEIPVRPGEDEEEEGEDKESKRR
ncbi:MAG TPA: DNA-directed RNA polymerase subunit omega [Candidatus Acidoferrales bacterium]|nr:DNA-directed RNA polymerase subunit omega [Candidatus Acidoferrales bacterium]